MKKIASFIFNLMNQMLAPLGLRLKRTNTPTRLFTEFFSHLSKLNYSFETVIDVGIAHGTPGLYKSCPNAKYYLIEPLEECRQTLERLKRKLNAEYHILAAGNENGEITFNVHPDLSGSSKFPQAEGEILDGIERQVRVARLDSIIPEDIAGPVLLKLDTQGAELEVFDGLGDLQNKIDMVIVETSLLELRKGVPLLADTVNYFERHDFLVYDILEGHTRYLDNALAQVDLVFVRKDNILRSDSRFFSDAQAQQYTRKIRKAFSAIGAQG